MKKLIFTIFFLYTSFSLAQIINVPSDQPTIQAGIAAASSGDTVLVAEGTYLENINFKGKAITVASHFILDQDTSHISKTIIDGSQPNNSDSGSVVTFNSGEDTTSVICGFTITGGTGTRVIAPVEPFSLRIGGGIFLDNSGAKIYNNIIRNNSTIDNTVNQCGGAGIVSGPPSVSKYLIIENNMIAENICSNSRYSNYGAGLYILSNSKIANNIIKKNKILLIPTRNLF